MDKRIVIHAGLPKTGTTSIQQFLVETHAAIDAAGIMFPCIDDPQHPGYFREGVGHGPQADLISFMTPTPYAGAPSGIDWPAALDRFAASRDHHTLLLSQENVAMRGAAIHPPVLNRLRAIGEVVFLVYLRNAVRWVASLHVQRTTGQNLFAIWPEDDPTLRRYLQKGYAPFLGPLQRRGRLVVADFDACAARGDLLADFCRRTGLAEVLAANPATPSANVAWADQAAFVFMRAFKQLHPDLADITTVRALLRARPAAQARPLATPFGPETMAALHRQWDRDRRMLANRFDLRFPPLAPPPPDAPPPDLSLSDTAAEDLRIRLAGAGPDLQPVIAAALALARAGPPAGSPVAPG